MRHHQSNPNSKQTQHGNDRRFYYPDLLRAACHYCDHLPGDTKLDVIVTRFPINPDGRITVSESEAEVLLHDLDNKRAPKGFPRRRGKRPPVRAGAYLARKTLALLRDAFDQDKARDAWESESAVPSPSPLLSSARPSSALYVTNGPRRAGRNPSRTPTSTRSTATPGRIAPKLSTTMDSVRGTSTQRKYFRFRGLLALVLWCLDHTAFLLLDLRIAFFQ